MRSQSRPGLRRSWAIWECPDRRPSGPVSLGKSGTWTGTAGFGPVQTGSQSVWDQTSPTLLVSVSPSQKLLFNSLELTMVAWGSCLCTRIKMLRTKWWLM